jgi:ankyrin repeat protein
MASVDHIQSMGELLMAADRGDTPAVAKLLGSGICPDARAAGGAPPLLMAVRNGHIATVELLLEHGAHPNPDGSRGYTALTHAIHRSLRQSRCDTGEPASTRPLELLLAAGARYNLIDAVLANDRDLVRAFLDEGGDPNEGEGSYNGPLLMEAARYGHVEMVDLLLDRGASIEAEDDLNQTALMEAARNNQLGVVRRLLDRGAEINAGYGSRMTALSNAAKERHSDLVAYLLMRGARWTLMDAFAQGDVALFVALLDEEILADVEHDEPEEEDRSDDPDRPARVDLVTGKLERIAMEAVGRGNLEIVRLLLDRGASHFLDWRDHHSLIAEASKHGHVEVARLLIDHGADLHAIGWDGLTPLAWAKKEGRSDIVDLLKHAGAER